MSEPVIDHDQYSRQAYTFGMQSMIRLRGSRICQFGLDGLGTEVAKNLILSGVKLISIDEPNAVTHMDLSTGYYFSEGDVGKNRFDAAVDNLRKRNAQVSVEKIDGDIDMDAFDVFVMCNQPIDEAITLNEEARKLGKGFIFVRTHGLFASVFVDFGDEFTVLDADGENIKQVPIGEIKREEGLVEITCTEPHDLRNGDHFVINNSATNDVVGPFEVKKGRDSLLVIDGEFDIDKFNEYSDIKQVKTETKMNFKSLAESLKDPEYMFCDYVNMERPKTIIAGLQLIDKFVHTHNRLPIPRNEIDFGEFMKLVTDDIVNGADLEKEVVKEMCFQAMGQIMPVVSFAGGFAAQECIKCVTGKYTPLKQWLCYESLKSLPEEKPTVDDCRLTNTRYDSQVAVFGNKYQDLLKDTICLMVGAGAIGCEHLKNYAMMGVGKIYVTDMDVIEKSNLNRQFLFGPENVGQFKSEAAAVAVKTMNPDCEIVPFCDKVCPETQSKFTPLFREADVILNALDNVQARLYVDERCVVLKKPLLESGTLGTKCNTQVIIPHLTESYGSSQDPPEKSIPLCTLKSFPNTINHTIQWGRDKFEEVFASTIENARKFSENPDWIDNVSIAELLTIEKHICSVLQGPPKTINDCIARAYRQWMTDYNASIVLLLKQFPVDHLNDDGELFWSGTKRMPQPIKFDHSDQLHMLYIDSYVRIISRVYGIEYTELTSENVNKIVSQTGVSDLFKAKIIVSANEEEEKKRLDEERKKIEQETDRGALLKRIKSHDLTLCLVVPEDFEKDDDANSHIDFVTATSNLRATNYTIPLVDRLETKRIAGKIIPAIVTTTAVVSGLVGLEFFKVISGRNTIEDFSNVFINLALPQVTSSDPIDSPAWEINGHKVTMWSSHDVYENVTMQELIKSLEKEYGSIESITFGPKMIHSKSMPFLTKKYTTKTLNEIIEGAQIKLTRNDVYNFIPVLESESDSLDFDYNEPSPPSVYYYPNM
jgi:ubiquitin-activating enzyme E1